MRFLKLTLEDLVRDITPNFHENNVNQNINLKEWKLPMPNMPDQGREHIFICTFHTVSPSLISLQCQEGSA